MDLSTLPLLGEFVNENVQYHCKKSFKNNQDASMLYSDCNNNMIGDGAGEGAVMMGTKELVNIIHGILNKVTQSNLDKFLKKIQNLPIDTEGQLSLVADLFYKKGVKEPLFSSTYAKMCQALCNKEVPSSINLTKSTNFRKLLLTKCQSEFEEDNARFMGVERKKQEIEENTNELVKQGLEEELKDLITSKNQKQSSGNVRFTGELFKLRILSVNVIHHCITHLLIHPDDEPSLEKLCVLLTTIGKDLDQPMSTRNVSSSNQLKMDSYFDQLDIIVSDCKISNRTRFKIQDVIDLRKHQWKSCRGETQPTPKEEVNEHEEEEVNILPTNHESTGLMVDQGPQQNNSGNGLKDNDDSKRKKRTKPDGISENAGDGLYTKDRRRYDDNLQLFVGNIPQSTTEEELKKFFIKCGNIQDIKMYGKNQGRTPVFYAYVIFDSPKGVEVALSMKAVWKGNHRLNCEPKRQEPPKRGNIGIWNNQHNKTTPGSIRSPLFHPLQEIREHNFGYSARSITLGVPTVPEAQILLKAHSVLCELLITKNIQIAVDGLKECLTPSTAPAFINQCLIHVLELGQKERRAIGSLLKEMLKSGFVTTHHVLKGFEVILRSAEDFFFDIPNLWDYLAQMIEPIFEEGVVNIGFLGDLSRIIVPFLAPCFVAATLKELVNVSGGVAGADLLWIRSNASLGNILPGVDVNAFISQNKELEFVKLSSASSRNGDTASTTFNWVSRNLEHFLREKTRSTEDICVWIECFLIHFLEIECPVFIRGLVSAIIDCSIYGSGTGSKLNKAQLQYYCGVLRHFVGNVAERQLELLLAVQKLVTNRHHPKGLIQGIFETLYESAVISEEGLDLWLINEDPLEQEGKAVALNSSLSFLTSLKEAEFESDIKKDEN